MSEKIAIITGASRGLGVALSHEFANHNWQVVGTGRSARAAELPAAAAYYQFDASQAEACKAFWQQLHQQHPQATICLVNNAGGWEAGDLTEVPAETYDRQMQSIYFSAVFMTHALAAVVPKARIINVISSSALAPAKGESAYGAAKAAERHFFQSLQREFTPSQYQITNLYPSDIATHGANPHAIIPAELAEFIRTQAEGDHSYYLRDVSLYPTN